MELKLQLKNETETKAVAEILASHLPPVFRFGLSGPLGAGKTSFVRSFLKNLSPDLRVQSPSFVLEQVYHFPGQTIAAVSHWDLYRLREGDFPEELAEALQLPQLVFVEWPERSKQVMALLDLHGTLGYPERGSDPEQNYEEKRTFLLRAGQGAFAGQGVFAGQGISHAGDTARSDSGAEGRGSLQDLLGKLSVSLKRYML